MSKRKWALLHSTNTYFCIQRLVELRPLLLANKSLDVELLSRHSAFKFNDMNEDTLALHQFEPV